MRSLLHIFRPAPHRPLLPSEEVRRRYPRLRFQVLEATFLGYAMFYLVRNNLGTVAKDLETGLRYSHDQVGNLLAITAITYGVGKFLMGALSDRSNPRVFMACGLLLTAGCNFLFGATASYGTHLFLWGLNGLIQGMGWPPCGRTIGHWFSVRERGSVFAVWNIAHNVGGGIAGALAGRCAAAWGYQYAFYVPGLIAVAGAVYLLWRLRDTPQSEGLPPVEMYRNDFPGDPGASSGDRERELSFRELLVQHVLRNRALWLVAAANFFVYIARYAMLDWGPTYLREMKGADAVQGGDAVMYIEFAGIPSTLLMGWLSDRLGGRRGMVSLLCMLPVALAFTGILLTPPGMLWLDFVLLGVVGFFVYPPVMLLGVAALDLTSKKAVGTTAGFVGLFGYLGRTAQAKGFGWLLNRLGQEDAACAWNVVLWSIVGCALLAVLLLALSWKLKPRG